MTVQSPPAVALLSFDPITTAVTASTSSAVNLGRVEALTLEFIFLYGSGGTTFAAYVQTSFDNGTTWVDIAQFSGTTSALTRGYHLVSSAAVTTAQAVTDGTMTANTSLSGFLGPLFRVKYTTTGTYAGASSLYVWAYAK